MKTFYLENYIYVLIKMDFQLIVMFKPSKTYGISDHFSQSGSMAKPM